MKILSILNNHSGLSSSSTWMDRLKECLCRRFDPLIITSQISPWLPSLYTSSPISVAMVVADEALPPPPPPPPPPTPPIHVPLARMGRLSGLAVLGVGECVLPDN